MLRSLTLCALGLSLSLLQLSSAAEKERNVSWQAQAEIARRGALVENIAGIQSPDDAASAIAAAMQPPADDSHKWHLTLVVTRSCQWCERARRDFETDEKLRAWVDAKDYTKSWAHWQIVQIEDKSQEWRWKDFRPTAFPALILQPPANGSWGDPHTIVFARQGYLAPATLDAALRQAIQAYASKAFPRHLAWTNAGGHQQASGERGQRQPAGVNPPAPAPAPLAPLPVEPNPSYPSIPPQGPTTESSLAILLAALLGKLIAGPVIANFLLLAILAWHIYRGIAKREGIPLLLDDATAAKLTDFVQALRQASVTRPTQPPAGEVPHGPAASP